MKSAPFLSGTSLVAVMAMALFAMPALANEAGEQAASQQSQEIVVTATPFAHSAQDTPAIPAKVDADQIRQSGGSSIADALQSVPGISASGFAQGASRPIIRGMDSNRVRLLENGTSISDVSDIGPDHGTPLDPLSARSIEVVRGAATLRYGSQAIGGVINVLNDRVPMRRAGDPLRGEFTSSFGTVNDAAEVSALIDTRSGNLALHADGFYRHTGDYQTPLGVQANSFFRGWGGSVGGSLFSPGGSHSGLAVTHYDTQYGIPAEAAYIDMRQTKLISRSVFLLGDEEALHLDGSYGDYEHSEKEPDGTIVTTFRNKEGNLRGELLLGGIGPISNAAIGLEYQHRDFSAIGEADSYLQPATSRNLAAYAFTEITLSDGLHVEGAARIERVRVTGTPASNLFTTREFTPLSGAVGALLDLSDGIKLGFTASTTGRAPALTELFARGGHDGPQTYETGDPALVPERAKGLEMSLRVERGPFEFDGSIYSTWFGNYVYGDLTGRTCDDLGNCLAGTGQPLREVFYRQQNAHFRGVEAEARLDLIKQPSGLLALRLMGDYTRASLDDGSNVPRIAPWRIGGGLKWTSTRFDAGFDYMWHARQDQFGAFDTPTQGYSALSLHLAWRPFKDHPGIELGLVGQNLTDDVQLLATSFNKDLVMAAGRSIRFTLRVASF
ncbi:MAG: TonB-dependent receptor [Novosphingobium sp.]|uniref:TonB-dependent receptor plug domain-containing protein n=1 Tax=Novosphingobium sp. TaxID=1874826 RepID=UPI0032B8AEB0